MIKETILTSLLIKEKKHVPITHKITIISSNLFIDIFYSSSGLYVTEHSGDSQTVTSFKIINLSVRIIKFD